MIKSPTTTAAIMRSRYPERGASASSSVRAAWPGGAPRRIQATTKPAATADAASQNSSLEKKFGNGIFIPIGASICSMPASTVGSHLEGPPRQAKDEKSHG